MTEDRFALDQDHQRRFLRITLQGDWNHDTVDHYREAVRVAVRNMVLRGYHLEDAVILLDTRTLPVQTRDVADYYSRAPIYSGASPKKIATLTASRLVGIQLRRISTGAQQVFEDERAALTWLLAQSE